MIVYLLEGERDIGFVEHTSEVWAERPTSWPRKNWTWRTFASRRGRTGRGCRCRAFQFVLNGEVARQRFAELGTHGRVEAA